MPRPSVQGLSPVLRALALEIAERLAQRGFQAWIVGGAVRDLALGLPIKDLDFTSAATPEVIEAEFLRTIPIGREFGTLVIHCGGVDVEHTTFRTEEAYTDARRPDLVRYGSTPEEDATRRDFRCNALYLDPRTDEVRDPSGGLADLAAGRLSCVGDPVRRFAEDGLRIVRLARFGGQLELTPTPETLAGARASVEALRGISRERLRVEFESMWTRGGAARALTILEETGALERVLPEFRGSSRCARVRATFAQLPREPGIELGFATLLDPMAADSASIDDSVASLESLRPARHLLDAVRSAWQIVSEFEDAAAAPRSRRIRWMRQRGFATALALANARAAVRGAPVEALAALRAERERLSDADLDPAPWIVARDLQERGFVPGPLYGILLDEALTMQLDLRLNSRGEALAWLERRLQDGGNARRSP